MNRVRILFVAAGASLCLAAGLGSAEVLRLDAQPPTAVELSLNDVSWLFPLPKRFDEVISIQDLGTPKRDDPTKHDPIWSDEAFYQLLSYATSDRARDAGAALDLPDEARSRRAWYIAAVRFDPGAPGLSTEIARQYGQSAQIRLIVQPIGTDPEGALKIHDLAVHLVFSFSIGKKAPVQPGCAGRPIPDDAAFLRIIKELAAIRDELRMVGVDTGGKPLGIHPAFDQSPAADDRSDTADLARKRLKALLQRHLSAERLTGMAVAGLAEASPADKPKWVFLLMQKLSPGEISAYPSGGWAPLPGPALDGRHFSEVFDPRDGTAPLKPTPHPNNVNPITCKNYLFGPDAIAHPAGKSAAEIFRQAPGLTQERRQDIVRKIFDPVRDPKQSHVFNTDCVSCHTETSLPRSEGIGDPEILDKYQPLDESNARNFGWGGSPSPMATVTRRTLNETKAVLSEINRLIQKGSALSSNTKSGGKK